MPTVEPRSAYPSEQDLAWGCSSPRVWWRNAVFYQVYPKSFADANGDGIGDLAGVCQRLDYLAQLGVDALWLSPFYRSPMADGGYDVSDPCDVDPIFGTLNDFDVLVQAAHLRSLRVTVDIVPNHFSEQHPWFQQALAAGPGSRERARFIFRTGRGASGELPPNNWPSVFGGPAWEQLPDGEWYLHLFAPEQPDINWEHPDVPAEFERILRFWLDRGVDGFRVDVAHTLAKPQSLPDLDLSKCNDTGIDKISGDDLRWDHDRVHDHLRAFRRVLDAYPGERMAVGEAWVKDDARLARYVRPDELNLTFNFRLIEAEWGAAPFYAAIDHSLQAMRNVGAPCTWVLSNHDVVRHRTRYGNGTVGLARARAAALVQLSLPGAAYLYNGDELGLPNVDLPDWALQDPTWERSGHTDRGRDGARVPIPWEGSVPPFGFTPAPSTWLPMPESWAGLSVETQLDNPDSTLLLYRRALEIRATTVELQGDEFTWLSAPDSCLAYRRGRCFTVALNATDLPVTRPSGDVILSSGPMDYGVLPPNTAAWIVSKN